MSNRINKMSTVSCSFMALLALASPVWGRDTSDGVVLINQAKALAGNITPGDKPGFPVTISRQGSYRLSGNFTVPNPDTTAIETTTNNGVTLDLNGFVIKGPTVCSGDPLTCSPTGSGRGVDASNTGNTTVINGRVIGMGDTGVFLGPASGNRVEGVSAISNGGIGIAAPDAIVTGNIAESNGGDGIVAPRSIVAGNTAAFNGNGGIRVAGGTVTGSRVYNNRGAGIIAIESLVTGNTAGNNSGFGIIAVNSSTVLENTVVNNVSVGLVLSIDGAYANNVVNGNNGGNANPQVDGGVEIGTNLCGRDTTCP